MAALFLTGASNHSSDWFDYPAQRIRQSHRLDIHRVHSLAESPEQADVILFASNFDFAPLGLGLWREPLFRRFRKKCILFDSNDNPSPIFGGLCASWHSGLDAKRGHAAGWCYFHPLSAEPQIDPLPWQPKPEYLWSFLGSRTNHIVRGRLFDLAGPDAIAIDTSERSLRNLMGLTKPVDRETFLGEFRASMRNAMFVVCPRGVGPSSMRIFEAMRAGRAPVIVSDQLELPPFVDWNRCSLRIPEAEIGSLREYLQRHEQIAQELGNNARNEWERVFGNDGLFHFTVEACLALLSKRRENGLWDNVKPYLRALRAPHRRILLRHFKKVLLS